MKVDFIIPGAMKCGTSTLSKILSEHPQVSFSDPTEPNFFSHSKDWRSEVSKYHGHFEKKDGVIYGEKSTGYTKYPFFNLNIWEDIYEYNKEMKFIYLVRNPIDRVISHYMHSYQRGYTKSSLEKAIIEESEFIDFGRYYTQIKPYIDRFGIQNVLIVDFEDLMKSRVSVLKEVAFFLNIDFAGFQGYRSIHQNATIGKKIHHHKYDWIKRAPIHVGKFVPKFLKKLIRRILAREGFDKKPELHPDHRKVIINRLRLDILALNEICDHRFTKWLNEE